jgi:hypothetical protein
MALNHLLSDLYVRRDKEKLKKVQSELLGKQKELDQFFEEYLEVFDDKLNASIDNQNTPEWKAYNDKYSEYTDLKKDLKLANYYLGII